MVCIANNVAITIPFGVRVVRILTLTNALVMKSLILVSIGVKVVAKTMLIGVRIATNLTEMIVVVVMVVR